MSAVTVPRGGPTREMSGPVLGMVLFVASEAMFFAAFFGGYFTIRDNAKVWPPRGIPHLEIGIATILTVLLVDEQPGHPAVAPIDPAWRSAARQRLPGVDDRSRGHVPLLQLYDYSQLGFGVKDGAFGTLFYVMTGIHMAHVLGGVVFLALVFGQAMGAGCRRRTTTRSPPAPSIGTSST